MVRSIVYTIGSFLLGYSIGTILYYAGKVIAYALGAS